MTELEKKIGFSFNNADLLKEALTHRSYLNENPNWTLPHNERLEFLGDAVLELAVTEELYANYPTYPEGQLTVLRAALVNYQRLARVALDIDLEKYLYMSKGERGDQSKAREVILANAMEALLGAIYLDQGFEPSKAFTKTFILKYLPEILETRSYKDPKSELQEIVQERLRVTPTYRVLDESGPAHRRNFRIGVYFGEEMMAEGIGTSKQEGETVAAREALTKLQTR
jgi:ribonuclease III